jgi:hypothetical protein
MNNNLTSEQIELSVLAAFDSVNIINNSESSQNQIDLNIEHLKIMMTKDWFVKALNKNQKTEINSIIS